MKAPHTGQPYTEAMLMGIGGGIVMGYYPFAYEGYDPQARILTRNTFDPLNTLLERLGVIQNRVHTADPAKTVRKLEECLKDNMPAIVWADMFSLPYNALLQNDGMWVMLPIVVYGYDESTDRVWIADRARVPLYTTTSGLAAARGGVKNNTQRLLTLEPPIPDKFPAGARMYSGPVWAFKDTNTFGNDGQGERDVYADYLEEASLVVEKPSLREVAGHYRRSAQAWDVLSQALLPDEVPLLGETRQLLLQRHRMFIDQGMSALEDFQHVDARLAALKGQAAADFPLDAAGAMEMRENISRHVLEIRDIEKEAVEAMQSAMG